MPRATSPLQLGRPMVEIELCLPTGGTSKRNLLADTGAGSCLSAFQLIRHDTDCQLCGGNPGQPVVLGGAYEGSFPVYTVRIEVPVLNFNQYVSAVAVPSDSRLRFFAALRMEKSS